MKKNITILWWTDGFGKWLWRFLLKNFSSNIKLTITWRNKIKWAKVSKELNCDFYLDNIKASKKADIIIFSVPIFCMKKTMKEVLPYIRNTAIVLDVTSIKGFTTKTMEKYSPKWVLIIPTHPMFWPYYNTIAGQIVVLTPKKEIKEDKRYKKFKNFLWERWAKVIETTSRKHDKMMAVVQWLTHYNMFVLWETIKRLKLNIEESMNFVSPIYKIMMSSVSRYVWHNPKLYWDIQMYNEEVLEIHKIFMETSNDFNEFVKNKDEKGFINMVKWTQKYFWKKNTTAWQKYIDKTTYLISKQTKKIKLNIWKQAEFENIYSWDIIKDMIIDFDYKNIFLKGWEKLDINEREIK